MLELPVYNQEGAQVGTMSVDEALLGSFVRRRLLKQAVDMYHAGQRQGTVATRSRGLVEGSTRKLYRQKHTGRARMGTIRTVVRRGGGVAFAKIPRDLAYRIPKHARRLARDSAILSKMQDGQFLIIDRMAFERPKTQAASKILKALKIDGSCLIGLDQYDTNVYLSVRNLPRTAVLPVDQFNAHDILLHRQVLVTKAALEKLLAQATGNCSCCCGTAETAEA